MNTCRHQIPNAFTLIELLVVIGIISILAAVIIPSLSAARRTVLGMQCMSNHRGMTQAMTMYTIDNHQTFPTRPSRYITDARDYPFFTPTNILFRYYRNLNKKSLTDPADSVSDRLYPIGGPTGGSDSYFPTTPTYSNSYPNIPYVQSSIGVPSSCLGIGDVVGSGPYDSSSMRVSFGINFNLAVDSNDSPYLSATFSNRVIDWNYPSATVAFADCTYLVTRGSYNGTVYGLGSAGNPQYSADDLITDVNNPLYTYPSWWYRYLNAVAGYKSRYADLGYTIIRDGAAVTLASDEISLNSLPTNWYQSADIARSSAPNGIGAFARHANATNTVAFLDGSTRLVTQTDYLDFDGSSPVDGGIAPKAKIIVTRAEVPK